jgi:hypothetical protein
MSKLATHPNSNFNTKKMSKPYSNFNKKIFGQNMQDTWN